MTNNYNIVLLGSGNVANHLAEMFIINDINISQIFNINKRSGITLAKKYNLDFTNEFKEIRKDADLYIIAVKDNYISDVIKNLNINNGTVVHTSGTTDINVFNNKFKNYGILYPLQTFTKDTKLDYNELPFFIESNNVVSLETISYIANKISKSVTKVNSKQRKILHIAAIFACNFTNYLYTISDELLSNNNLDFNLLKPLIKETTRKALIEKPANNQTGPAKRKDLKVINEHLSVLENNKEMKQIYGLISEFIINKEK